MTTSAFYVTVSTPPALPTADVGTGEAIKIDAVQREPRARLVSAASEDTRQLESETEDEEVKMNCIGGLRGVQDSDMNTTDDDEDDDVDDDDQSLEDEGEGTRTDRNQGVVSFSSVCRNTFPLVRPKATTPTGKRLSPHDEIDESRQDCSSDSSVGSDASSSVGARGVPLSFTTQSAMSEDLNAGDDEHEDGDSEDEEDDDASLSSSSDSESPEDEDAEAAPSTKTHSTKSGFGTDAEVAGGDVSGENIVEPDLNDDELSDILQSLGEDRIVPVADDLDTSERFIGVMEDREDLITVPKAKRVLSFNTLAALNIEARGQADLPKRQKCPKTSHEAPSLLTMFSLGPPAMVPMSDAAMSSLHARRDSPVISTSSDDEEEELDRQLGEELNTAPERTDECRAKTPVPLLTPPGSPLTIEVNGDTTQVCEWPSNLAVENAMTAVSELRPMSPASLENLGRQDQEFEETHRRPSLEAGPSTLTPMLRGISVGE